jgi:trigger factor
MNYKIEKKDDVHIDVTIPWNEVQKKFDKIIADAAKNVSVKGFRKGAVPQEIAEAQVDRAKALSETADALLREHYVDIVKKESLKVVGAPRVNVTKLAENNDIEVKIIAAALPEITLPKKWKDAIKKINKEKQSENVDVTDEKVDEEIKHIAASRAEHKEVERAAQKDDHVKIDFTVKKDGVVIENGTSKDHSLVLGKGVFIPGFEEEIIGMKKGDQKIFELTFPEQYHAKNLAGKKAEFDVVLNIVEERIMPDINDAFAASLGDQFKTIDDLKKSVKDGIKKEEEKKNAEQNRTAYLDALTEMVDVDLPHAILHEELHRMMGEFEQQLSMSGMQFDDYLQKINKTREDLEKEWAPQAKKRVLSALILEVIADDEEMEIDSKDIEAEMNKTLAMYKGVKDMEKNIDMGQLYEYTKGVMRNDKVFDMLEKL